MNTITIPQLLDTSKQIRDDLKDIIARSRPPVGGPDRIRFSLLLTISEQFEATLLLAEAHMSTHAATHVRSMIEALVAMRMLASNAGYVEHMKFEKLKGQQRVYKGILEDPNIPDEFKGDIKTRYEDGELERKAFQAAGFKSRKISDDFGPTGLWHLVGPYSMLCACSHNDLIVLAMRHQGVKSMTYRQGDSPTFVEAILSTALIVVMDAAEQFGNIAKFPDNHFESLFNKMDQKWSSVLEARVESS